jgi:hypothetical protein
MDGDTPLHAAIRYATEKSTDLGTHMADLLCDAGADPRVRNKGGQKPIIMVTGGAEFEELRDLLRKAEYAYAEGIVEEEDVNGVEGGSGSGSESDN